MLQFYFLSVLLNVLAGLVLVYATDYTKALAISADGDLDALDGDPDADDISADDGAATATRAQSLASGAFMDDLTFRLVLGSLSLLVGVLKLFSPIQNDVPIVGDLIPAVAGIFAAAAILIEFYAKKLATDVHLPFFLQGIFVDGRRYLGVFCIIAGIMHFIFPRIMLL